ncbi:hypothetical protein N8I77_005863 [Diaporthe amygdali]|uniref:Xylanolytic transcriptional activator regulatory domain-containing protein n=1 Tax=Phomopsis amygdali TaxID=1214568 RepID=A0AAD9W3E0_PHOAM|nr:hypothetical protein N8I77_005863 [Diaporthe amygdali]
MHLRRRNLQTITPCFREGMRFVEEFDLPLRVSMPNLPDFPAHSYIETFFVNIWPLIPVIDREFISAEFDRLHRKQLSHPGGLGQVISKQDVPSIVSIFAILAIGADEAAGSATEFGSSYIQAAYSLYGHLVANPYLSSVQALMLLGFALRGKSKDGQCWQLTGQAVRIAHSIGLHRHISSRSRPLSKGNSETFTSGQLNSEHLSLEARVWWSCYAIERLMELETGRPSALTEQEIDQIDLSHPQHVEADCLKGPLHLFVLWVSLAMIMGQISEHLYRKRIADSWQLLYETGRLDQLLLEWVKTVPEGIKPGHELVHLAPDAEDTESGHQHQHIAAFLSLQYYQAQITLFRASLAFPTQKYLEETRASHAIRRLPSYLRLLQSQNLSIAAARSMARQVLEIADHVVSSKHLFAPTQPFLAAVVLGLNVLKNPGKRMIRSDVELIVGTTEYIEAYYRKMGQSTEFVKVCERLRTSILEAVAMEGPSPIQMRRESQPANQARPSLLAANIQSNEEGPNSGGMDIHMSGIEPLVDSREGPTFFEPYEGITLEQLWTSMSSDFLMGQPLEFNNSIE